MSSEDMLTRISGGDTNTRVNGYDCQALGWHCKAAAFRGQADAASYETMAVNIVVSSVSLIIHN